MADLARESDVLVSTAAPGVATVEINRAPNNFFDTALIRAIADVYEALAGDGETRAIVLCAAGKHFCAGMDFATSSGDSAQALYAQARRLVAAELPVVAAVHGAAVGGGLGLALSADFRVASSQSRFAANFVSIGLHPGFGLTVTLPEVVGRQAAADLMLTGRRITGVEAQSIGLVDRLSEPGDERAAAIDYAKQLAAAAPLASRAVKRTLLQGAVENFATATATEFAAQSVLFDTADFAEGVRAGAEHRPPIFRGR